MKNLWVPVCYLIMWVCVMASIPFWPRPASMPLAVTAPDSAVNAQALSSLQHEIDYLRRENALLWTEWRESVFGHDGVVGSAGEYGACQFKKSTFYWFCDLAGFSGLDWRDRWHQYKVMRWAFDSGYAAHWEAYKTLVASRPDLAVSK